MIKCIAIDDEPLALQQLVAYISKIPFLSIVGQCQSAIEAKQIMQSDVVDAIFCDINMPDLNGMDFVKSLASPPIIVFTTAYSEYAVEGYKVDAVDYLLKPFGLDEFQRAANKVKRVYEQINDNDSTSNQSVSEDASTLFLKTEHRIVKVDISDILYVEGMSEYMKIHLISQPKPLIVLLSMKKLEERLPSNFMRIHRSYIINLDKIIEVNKNRVIIDNDAYLPIGDLYKETFNNYLNTRFLGK
ncbi:MAG: response regulator transcription factor [Prevotella sp.]|nr:response regulator transcription factor [Prevotella sp.]